MRIYMMMGGQEQFIVQLSAFNFEAKKKLRDSIIKWTRVIYQGAVSAAPFGGTGTLIRNIRVENPETLKATRPGASGLGGQDFLIGRVRSNAHHSLFVEFGTGPEGARTTSNNAGRPPWHNYHSSHKFPPFGKNKGLAKWAVGIGLNPFSVAMGIFRNQGTKARPFLHPGFIRHRDQMITDLQQAVYGAVTETNSKLGKDIPVDLVGALV